MSWGRGVRLVHALQLESKNKNEMKQRRVKLGFVMTHEESKRTVIIDWDG